MSESSPPGSANATPLEIPADIPFVNAVVMKLVMPSRPLLKKSFTFCINEVVFSIALVIDFDIVLNNPPSSVLILVTKSVIDVMIELNAVIFDSVKNARANF